MNSLLESLDWPQLGFVGKPKHVETFEHGKSHLTELIEIDDRQLVIKHLDYSYDISVSAQQLAAEHGLAPAIYFAEKPTLVMEYIALEDHSWNAKTVAFLANSLGQLHSIETSESVPKLDLVSVYQDQISQVKDCLIRSWYSLLQSLIHKFASRGRELCFCHNDLVIENILVHNQQVTFIDWEYAALNDPWFDLAAVRVYADLSDDLYAAFLEAYKQGWSEHKDSELDIVAQICVLYLDLIWQEVKDKVDQQDKLNKIQALKNLATKVGIELTA